MVANQKRFGRSTETLESLYNDQISLVFNEAEDLATPEAEEPNLCETIVYKRKKQVGKREMDLQGLPVEVIEHDVDETSLHETFGEKWKTLPDEVYLKLRHTPAKYTVEEHHVKVYAGEDNQTFLRGEHPKGILSHSIITPSLASSIINEKFVKAVPLHRQEQEFQRNGINLSRQVMANWMIQCSDRYLQKLFEYLRKQLLGYHVLQADETPVLVKKDKEETIGKKNYMWVYRTGKMYTEKPIILYDYQKERKADHPREFLKEYAGVVVTDGYQVYHTLADEREDLAVAGCWSHARRRFAEAVKAAPEKKRKGLLSTAILEKIQEIYTMDNALRVLSNEERVKTRQKLIKPLVEAFFEWLKEIAPMISTKTKTSDGIQYCLNQEKYLKYFLEDGEVPMDNNAAEQAIRGFCIGKKNWVMIETVNGAKASAVLYSLVETAKANKLNPYEYFKYLLEVMPEHEADQTDDYLRELLPWSGSLPAECRNQL